jgi:hypothetical protein
VALLANCLIVGLSFLDKPGTRHRIAMFCVTSSVLLLPSIILTSFCVSDTLLFLPLSFCPYFILIQSHFIYLIQELETDEVLMQLKYIQMVCLRSLFIS